MSGFSNSVIGGMQKLIRAAIQSPNFVTGLAGWIVRKDGSAEFNNLVIRKGQIISGTALYYSGSGTPQLGKLLASIAAAGGTDIAGNAYLGGVTRYVAIGGGPPFLAIQLSDNIALVGLQIWTATSATGPWTPAGSISQDSSGNLNITPVAGQTTNITAGGLSVTGGTATDSETVTGQLTATGGTAGAATKVTTDAWNAMILTGGWTAGGYARYRLNPDRTVEVQGVISAGTLTNGTSIWSAPAGYVPTINQTQNIPVMIETSTGAAGVLTPRVGISLAGNLFIENIPAGTTLIGFNGRYSLD